MYVHTSLEKSEIVIVNEACIRCENRNQSQKKIQSQRIINHRQEVIPLPLGEYY